MPDHQGGILDIRLILLLILAIPILLLILLVLASNGPRTHLLI